MFGKQETSSLGVKKTFENNNNEPAFCLTFFSKVFSLAPKKEIFVVFFLFFCVDHLGFLSLSLFFCFDFTFEKKKRRDY